MAYLLSQLLTESAERFPDHPALLCGRKVITYRELDELSGRIAAALIQHGLERGARVGLYLNKSIEAVAALFGVLKAGAVYVPFDTFTPFDRLSFMVENCGIRCLITSHEGARKMETAHAAEPALVPLALILSPVVSGGEPWTFTATAVGREAIDVLEPAAPRTEGVIDRDLAYILYTSGSTGTPKGVMLSHLNALTFVTMTCAFFSITSADRLANHAPLHFDLSVFDLFCAIKVGGSVVLLTETDVVFPAAIASRIAQSGITIWNSVPSALIQLVTRNALEGLACPALRLVLFAGELFPCKYLRALMTAWPGAVYYNMYGQTEANSSTYYKIEALPEPGEPPLPIGKAFPNYDVFALDEAGSLLAAPGAPGELYVRGATVGCGYWNDPVRTSQSFVRNPLGTDPSEVVYRTGDLVTLRPDGNYVFVGRKDTLVKSRGFRIDMGEVEATLFQFPAVAEAAVVAVPDDELGNRLVGFVCPSPGQSISVEELTAFCHTKIPRYMVPGTIKVCETFPRTTTGKVDRRKLQVD